MANRRKFIKSTLSICGVSSIVGCLNGSQSESITQFEEGEFYANVRWEFERPVWREEPEEEEMEDFARGTNIEITQHPNQDPTEEDYNSAYAFYDETYDSMVQNDLLTVESAEEEGYVKWDNIHWIHPDRLLEEGTLNTNKPESLVFQDGELVGVMYLQNKLTDRGEQFAGPLTMWHYHPLPLAEEPVCMGEQITQQSSADVHYPCREGAERRKRSPEMIHVWLKKHPKGQYATRMRNLPDEFQEREPFKMSEEEFREHTEETYYSYHISEDAV